jgi:outer membrane immunogenic protein
MRQLTPSDSDPKGKIMRRLQCALLVAAIATGFASVAAAADMPIKASPLWSAPATGPLWEGIYVGVNLGDANARSTWCTDAVIAGNCETGPTDVVTGSPRGLVGGGQFGDRWQWGNVVVGLEGMYDALSITTTGISPVVAGETLATKFTGLYSATGEIGLAFDRLLAYGKGGWAGTELKLQAQSVAAGGSLVAPPAFVDGWTLGGGLEYQLMPHIILGVEYDYYRFNPTNIINVTNSAGALITCAFCNFGSSTHLQTILGRISFQAGPAPAF